MRRIFKFWSAACAMLLAPAVLSVMDVPAHAAPESYTFDKSHTEIRFSWDHLGLSRQSGRFLDIAGEVVFDPERPETSRIDVRIPVKSLTTGVPALDDVLLKTPDYLNVAANPDITFKSTGVVMTTAKTANVSGELSFNGFTRPAMLSVVWNFSGEHPLSKINPVYAGVYASGFSARTQILRSEFGITRSIPLVSDELRITIEAELHRR
ncbi:MAG: YceI family protein [Planctomycetes bacterium]|nr:YceI family protein [Planctomycetota bacterium]